MGKFNLGQGQKLGLEETMALAVCREDFISYCYLINPKFELANHHNEIAKNLTQVDEGTLLRVMLFMPPRHGKQVADNTGVLTNAGWTTHGQLRPGDQVFAPDGKPTTVVAVSGPSLSTLEVTFTNGSVIHTHPNHEWTVFDRGYNTWRTVETSYIASQKYWSGGRARFQLPEIQALETPSVDLPMDPYTLGAWLGDGTTGHARLTLGSKKKAVAKRVGEAYGEPNVWEFKKQDGAHYNWGVAMAAGLNFAGVLHDKHIPETYLRSGTEQRRQLLAGLVDSDGHIDKNGRIRIVTTNLKLRDGIFDLATTLALHPYLMSQEAAVSSSGVIGRERVWTIGFQSDGLLPVVRCKGQSKGHRKIGIQSIKPCPPQIGRCIQVDREDGLYLVGRDLIPTHNSLLTSILFVSWYLGRHPDRRVVFATYGQALADHFGREVRNIIASKEHQAIFPSCTLSEDSTAADQFDLKQGGGYKAVGKGGPLTGMGCSLLVVDDPLKDDAEASSDTIRESLKQWYAKVAYTRLTPDGAVIILMTRWHVDDLAGWLLKEHPDEDWKVVNFPAIAEENEAWRKEGEALWPERFPLKKLWQIQAQLGPSGWTSLYQQHPTLEGGYIFDRKWIRHFPNSMIKTFKSMNRYIVVDPANTKKKKSDATAAWVVGLAEDGNYYCLEIVRDYLDIHQRIKLIFDLHRTFHPLAVGYESYGLQADIPLIQQEMAKRNYYFEIKPLGGIVSKIDRVKRLVDPFRQGKMFLPEDMIRVNSKGENLDLVKHFIDKEFVGYPGVIHDDMLDALSRLFDPDFPIVFPRTWEEDSFYQPKRKGSAWAS